MSQGVARFVVFTYLVTLAHSCDLVHRPDCAVLPPGSLHQHEASCSHFYRCDEFHNAMAYTCPPGQRFINHDGELCAPEDRVICDRCPQAASRCGDCSCSPTTPPPCLTTTPGPCTVEPTTESPTSRLPSSSTTSTGVSFTTERITQPTTERYTPHDCPPIPSCVGSSSGTLRPYPPDCSKFLYCDDYDVAKLVSCNIGEHFSPTQLQCMPISEANCPICVPDYTIPDMTTVSYFPLPDCPPIPDCLDQPPGSVQPFPPDCSKYVYCLSSFIPDISSCPPGQHFSPEYLTCLLPEIANCPQCITSTTTTPAPTTNLPDCAPMPSCANTEPGLKLPFPQDCGIGLKR
ncbi:hypothetical protein B566_EDAN008718 [Ephemera danica]|nr:hypothetical protein B566_EDAN008718 [Ephemera danica]